MTTSHGISRRAALKSLLGGAVATAGLRWVHASQATSSGLFIEKQSSGAEIWQVTTEPFDQSNIYGEIPYCSRDSRYFVYARNNPGLQVNRTQFMAVELGTWKQHQLDTAIGLSGCAVANDGLFYYLKRTDAGAMTLMRADLADGNATVLYELQDGLTIESLGTVSADERYYAGGAMTEPGWKMFDIALIDLEKGEQRIIDRDPFILNPHPQFESGAGRTLLIQHNRGGTYSSDGKLEHLVGPEGATLYLLSVPEGKRTLLEVGTPSTTPCTGHEAWIGATGEVLLSVEASGKFAADKGNLLAVRAGSPARMVARGFLFNHVGVSRCGRIFSGDDWQPPFKIVLGSTRVERAAAVCESKTQPKDSHNSHAHPYVTPDLKWVIYNSNRNGQDHIYAARVPDELMATLLA